MTTPSRLFLCVVAGQPDDSDIPQLTAAVTAAAEKYFPGVPVIDTAVDQYTVRRMAPYSRPRSGRIHGKLQEGDGLLFASVVNMMRCDRTARAAESLWRDALKLAGVWFLHNGELREFSADDDVVVAAIKRDEAARTSRQTKAALAVRKRAGLVHCRSKTGYKKDRYGQWLVDERDRRLCRELARLHAEGESFNKLGLRFCIAPSTVMKKVNAANDDFPLSEFYRLDDDGTQVMLADPRDTPYPRNTTVPVASK